MFALQDQTPRVLKLQMVLNDAIMESSYLMQLRHPNIIYIFESFDLQVYVPGREDPRNFRVIMMDRRCTMFAIMTMMFAILIYASISKK